MPGHIGIVGRPFIAVTSLADAILALSPLGYWKLDEASGATAVDSSGNARDGTYTGTLTLGAIAGPPGKGNYPDFQGGHVTIPDDNVWTLDTAPGMSFFALCLPDDVSTIGHRFIVSKGTGAGSYEWTWGINIPSAGSIWFESHHTANGNTLRDERTAGGFMISTDWNAVGVSRLNGGVGGTTAIYYNQTGPAGLTSVIAGGINSNASAPVVIADRLDPGGSLHFRGGIAHVAIFAGVLNQAAFDTIMAAAFAEGWF